jgi:hypothetical protein
LPDAASVLPLHTWLSKDARAAARLFGGRLMQAQYLIHWSRAHQYIYVEVPKTGCSTVKLTLQRIERNEPTYIPTNKHTRSTSPLLQPLSAPGKFLEARTSPEYFRFCFVRNPYSRILSAYLEKIAGTDFKRDERMKVLGMSPATKPTFLEFLEVLARTDPATYDIHWARQCDLAGLGGMTFDFIGRFETFERDFGSVLGHFGQDARWLAAERDHRTDAVSQIQKWIGPRETALIEELYHCDFDRFAYSRDPASAAI